MNETVLQRPASVTLNERRWTDLFGKHRSCKPSLFIEEIPAHCIEEVSLPTVKKKKASREKQLSLF